jgi:hypothetical protein
MPLKPGYSRATVNANIGTMLREGKRRDVAFAAAMRAGRESFFKAHPKGFPPFHLRTLEEKKRTGLTSKYAGNPVPPSSRVTQRQQIQLEDAAQLYADFSGHEPEIVGTLDKPIIPDVLIGIGDIDGIMYSTVRDGKLEKYVHQFKKSSRPLFAVSHDGKQLYMLGGAYTFTERGIVDKT